MFKRFSRTLGAAPTTSAHIGYTTTIFTTGTVVGQGSTTVNMVSPLTIPATGTWIINYVLRLNISSSGTATMTKLQTWMSTGGNIYGLTCNAASQSLSVSVETAQNGSFVLSLANGTSFSLNIDATYTLLTGGPVGTANTVSYVQFTRIG